jgi:uncharacterized C2H2 Zn-finger protein
MGLVPEINPALRCPRCGGFLYRVQVPKGETCLWCEECETVFLRRGREVQLGKERDSV